MNSAEINLISPQNISGLHAATCLLMTRFINGYQCPKLAHVIVHHLQKLLAHPATQENADSREMYLQLLEYWQNVSSSLIEQKQVENKPRIYH